MNLTVKMAEIMKITYFGIFCIICENPKMYKNKKQIH